MEINRYLILLPHGYPIKMVDAVLEVTSSQVKTRCLIKPDNPFLEKDLLSEMAYVELMAQTTAFFLIYQRYGSKIHDEEQLQKIKNENLNLGFLVSIDKFQLLKQIKVNDQVEVSAQFIKKIDAYNFFSAEIMLDKHIISTSHFMIYAE